ncbi:MAG: lipocalin family protein [Spirochaetes bacterium]|nr:lipocalin family protein [Spirochaetota bacterium]MBU1078994.1 lipocalin family protein [Spirochaetota bacterium]
MPIWPFRSLDRPSARGDCGKGLCIPDPNAPGRLKVKFFGLFEADYLIFGLDADTYSWALVGNDSRGYLWFLSRTPAVDEALLERMKAMAAAQGYDLSGLYRVPQKERKQ